MFAVQYGKHAKLQDFEEKQPLVQRYTCLEVAQRLAESLVYYFSIYLKTLFFSFREHITTVSGVQCIMHERLYM